MDLYNNFKFIIQSVYNLFNLVLSVELYSKGGTVVNGWSVVIGTFVACGALACLFTMLFPDDFTTDPND